MPVTELARLTLLSTQPQSSSPSPTVSTPSTTPPKLDPALLSDLKHAQDTLTRSSKHPFQLYQSIDDPKVLFIIGSWDSIAFHRNHFLPSPENQSLLQTLTDRIAVDFMFHIDVATEISKVHQNHTPNDRQDQHTLPSTSGAEGTDPTRPPSTTHLVLIRHAMAPGTNASSTINPSLDEMVKSLHDSLEKGTIDLLASGWRIPEDSDDPTETQPEFITFLRVDGADTTTRPPNKFDVLQQRGVKRYIEGLDGVGLTPGEVVCMRPLDY